MTISKTPRADLKRIVDPHAYALLNPDSAMQEAARIQRAMSTDMPVMPTGEPVERTDWIDWRGVVIGSIAIAVFCAVWVALP